MGIQKEYHQLLSQFTTDYNLEPITSRLSAIIKESLNNSSLKKHRQGTILIPSFIIRRNPQNSINDGINKVSLFV